MEPYKIVTHNEIFNGKIVRMIVDEIELPGGKIAKREVVLHHSEAAAILPVADNGDIFLVRQYRHPLGRHVLEIPAGLLDKGESPQNCALRELEEEIGYRAGKISFALAANNSIGVSNDRIHIYIAQNLVQTKQNLDADEFLTIERYSLAQCDEMIASGEIIDSKTILAIFAYKLGMGFTSIT